MALRQPIDIGRYSMLHPDGRDLIRGWLDHAAVAQGEAGYGSFEAFIYLWIAFNGWASCVTGRDADPEWRNALIADPGLNDAFARLVDDPTSRTAEAAARFRALWPVFRVDELRRLGIDYWEGDDRDRGQAMRTYIEAGARQFEPRCYLEHGEQPQLDWGHTLASLYRVRCNLFHGEKRRSSENDRVVVTAAYETLHAFVTEAALLV
jgi:hypothetical protein